MAEREQVGRQLQRQKKMQGVFKQIKTDRILYVLLFPTFLYFVIFHVWPIYEMKLAFYDYRIVGDNIYVGFKHFKALFSTPAFTNIIKNTLIISGMKIFLFFPFPVIFALLLNELKAGKLRKFTQIVSYLPHFLSWVVIAGIWYEILSPSSGIVMDIVEKFGGARTNLLTNKNSILWVLFASSTWRSIGWDSIIFLSAILGINTALYEAASIDGATRLQIIKRIIMPALAGPMITVLILNVGFVMSAGYDQILNFSNDAVLSRVDIIDTYVYRIGLVKNQYSFATAANLFKGIVGTVLILSTHFTSKKVTGSGAW
jgi:putative aldouronate transport system permease protein